MTFLLSLILMLCSIICFGQAPDPTTTTDPTSSPVPLINIYTTQPEDTLNRIAAVIYGDQGFQFLIYAANRHLMTDPDPDAILPSDIDLKIPPIETCVEFMFEACKNRFASIHSLNDDSNNSEGRDLQELGVLSGLEAAKNAYDLAANIYGLVTSSIRAFNLEVINDSDFYLGLPTTYLSSGSIVTMFGALGPHSSGIFYSDKSSFSGTYGVLSFPIKADSSFISIMWSVPGTSIFYDTYINVWYGTTRASETLLTNMYQAGGNTRAKDTWKTFFIRDNLFVDVMMGTTPLVNAVARIYTEFKPLSSGFYFIKTNQLKCLDLDSAKKDENTKLHIMTCRSPFVTAQVWRLDHFADNVYSIKNLGGTNALTSPTLVLNGTVKCIHQPFFQKTEQLWEIVRSGSAWLIRRKGTKYVLDVNGGFQNDGTEVQIHESNNTPAQLWTFEQAPTN